MKVKTKDGFEIEVNKDAFNNMETVDALVEMDEGNPLAISKLSNFMFSKEEKKRVYDYLRNKDGRIPIGNYAQFITEVMSLLGEDEKK